MRQERGSRKFIVAYFAAVALLAALRPAAGGKPSPAGSPPSPAGSPSAPVGSPSAPVAICRPASSAPSSPCPAPHPILSVPSYDACFPDSNHVQLLSARRWGVSPVRDRSEAEARKKELVYAGCSPFYHVDPLRQSIPYLVPRAAILLQDIGRSFHDSLLVKGLPLQLFTVTSVLRTQADVARLRQYNVNATENSCHLFGTTFDISYTRFFPLQVPGGRRCRAVRDDTLKYILSEVLRDTREAGRCHVKYEKKQKCFHITVR